MYSPRYGPGAESQDAHIARKSLVHPRPKLFLRNRVGLQHGIRLHFNTGILRVLQVVLPCAYVSNFAAADRPVKNVHAPLISNDWVYDKVLQ